MPSRTTTITFLGDTKQLQAAMDAAGLSADAASKEIGDSFDKASARTGGIFQKLGNTLSNWGLPFGESISGIGEKLGEAETKGQKFGQAMSTIGGTALLGFGVAAAGVAAESVHLASAFDSTVTSIAANAGITDTAAKKIGDAFLSTAGTTIYSGQEIASAYASVAAQLGATQGHALSTAQALSVSRAGMDLAEASGESLSTALSSLAGVMQTYGIKADGAAKAGDELFQSARLSGNSLSATTKAIQQLHTQLGAMTPPLGQVGGLLVDLANHGETGSRAIRSVSSSFTSMLKSSNDLITTQTALTVAQGNLISVGLAPLGKAYAAGKISVSAVTAATKTMTVAQKEAWTQFTAANTAVQDASTKYNSLGIQITNSQGKFVGIKNVIEQLGPALKGMSTQQERLAALQSVFGTSSVKLLDTIEAGPAAYDKATASVERANAAHLAAEKQAKTLNHQIELLKATAEDYGVKIGEFLIPKLEDMAKDTADVVEWFAKHKTAAEALAIVIAGPLAAAMAVYLVNTGVKMVQATQKAITSVTTLAAKMGLIGPAGDAAAAGEEAAGSAATSMGTEMEGAGVAATSMGTEMEGAGAAASGAAAEVEGAGVAMGGAEGAAAGLSGLLGPVGLALGAVGLAGYLASRGSNAAAAAFQNTVKAAESMPTTSMADFTLKIQSLTEEAKKLAPAIAAGGAVAAAAEGEYKSLQTQIANLKADSSEFSANLQSLSSDFGLTKTQVQQVADEIGLHLSSSLTKADVKAFRQGLDQVGTSADSTKSKVSGMSDEAVADLTKIQSKLGTGFTVADFTSLGQNFDSGIAGGILGSTSLIESAASAAAEKAMQSARKTINAKSPSKRAADEIGLPFVQGIAQGITSNTSLAASAVAQMAQKLMQTGTAGIASLSVPGSLVPASSSNIGPGGGSGGSPIPLTVQFNLDGTRFATALVPDLRAALYQRKRAVGTLELN